MKFASGLGALAHHQRATDEAPSVPGRSRLVGLAVLSPVVLLLLAAITG